MVNTLGLLVIAQNESFKIDDWVQIIVVILLVGGSALAAVAKKLIATFTPDEKAGKRNQPVEIELDDDVPPVGPPQRTRPAYPVAKPLPPRPYTPPPTAQPYPARPVARPTSEVSPPPFIESERREPTFPRPKPPASTAGPSPHRAARPSPVDRPSPRARPESGRDRWAAEQTTEADIWRAEAEDRHDSQALGSLHPESDLAQAGRQPASKTARHAAPARGRIIGLLTRDALRRAVLLNEILGPPVASRGPDQRTW